jgi:GT2 family glycosyltransferase
MKVVKKATILLCTPDIQSETTERCLNSLVKHTYSRLYTLVVADNNWDPKFSHPREINKCLKTLDTDYLVCIDDDIVLTPGWLEALLEVAEKDPSIGVVGCVHTYADGSINHSGGTLFSASGSIRIRQAVAPIASVEYTPYVCSACALIRKTPLLFDETYAKYQFETDYCCRLWEAGLRVAVSPHKIHHLMSQQMLQKFEQNKERIRETRQLDEVIFSKTWYISGRLDKLYRDIQDKLTHPEIKNFQQNTTPPKPGTVTSPARRPLTANTLLPLLVYARLKSLTATHQGRIAIFGAGKHTAWLEGILGKNDQLPCIAAILDDKPEGKRPVFGLKPVKANQFESKETDAIILSTDCMQKEMASRCRELYGQQVTLIDIYEGLPPGPYDKN